MPRQAEMSFQMNYKDLKEKKTCSIKSIAAIKPIYH